MTDQGRTSGATVVGGGKSSSGLKAKKSTEDRSGAGSTNQQTGLVAAKLAMGKKVGKVSRN